MMTVIGWKPVQSDKTTLLLNKYSCDMDLEEEPQQAASSYWKGFIVALRLMLKKRDVSLKNKVNVS